MPDPASIVLDCTLCGASVGMWTFSTIYRPLQLTYDSVESQNFCKKTNESGVCGLSAASCIGGISTSEDKGKEHLDDVGEGMTSTCQKNASDERVLDLSLKIAGGLPPTKQNSSSLLPLPSITQFKAGFPSGSEVGERVTFTESPKAQEKMQFTRQHGNSVNSRRDITESISINREGIDTAGSSKRKRIEGNRSERVNDTDGNTRNKRKRDGAIIGERCVQELGSSEYHGFSSVNAVDTCYRDRKENSTDSVDNIPHYLCKSDEGIEEGTGTNIATLSTVNRAESRAAESEVLVETARSVQRSEIVSRGDKPHNVSICEDSQHALLVDQAVADITSSKDSLANGVIMDFRAGGERSEVCEPTEVSEKQEKSDSVMPGPHNCAKIDDVVISNSVRRVMIVVDFIAAILRSGR
ncbi:hypothetical protein SUGI_0193150 [Cryptomeria japonica]|nr:hypothetical protein SUGI_0193150 [Cryptomeria japonica]